MLPLTAKVKIQDHISDISVSVVAIEDDRCYQIFIHALSSISPSKRLRIAEYVAAKACTGYKLFRCIQDEWVLVATCATVSGCQATALADYIKINNIQVINCN